MIRYADLGFRTVERSDIDLIRKEHNDESVLLMLKDVFPVSETNQEEWFRNITSNKSSTVYCIFKDVPEQVIGVWKLQGLDLTNRNTEVGIEIFSSFRGKGFSLNCFRMIFKYLFDNLNIHTVYSKIAEFNGASLKTAQRAGFRITGRIPESLFRDGKYSDDIILAITLDNYINDIKPHLE